jgi:starch-binding outer membrane protein, SusD/RagB family
MKFKPILYTALAGLLLTGISCSKSYLEVSPQGKVLESNYYQTADQVFSALVSAYHPMAAETDYGINWYANKLGPLNCASDECYAGGGSSTDMMAYQVWNNYTMTSANAISSKFWAQDYAGIFRANLLISKLSAITVSDLSDTDKERYIAECKTLRAYYYFELVRLFENIPLSTEPISTDDMYNIVQADPAEVYAQIELDLTEAIPVLPSVVPTSENGRLTKGAAMAMLGKAILYQNDESRMSEAADWLNLVNTSGVYQLLDDYEAIFDPGNKFNAESILEICHSGTQQAWWGTGDYQGNIYVAMIGPRSYSALTDDVNGAPDENHTYYSGWSVNPIIESFAAKLYGDPRYKYTVADLDSLVEIGQASYLAGYANTGLFIQKYAPLLKWKCVTGQDVLNFPNDVIEIRLADTYLMEAEALIRAGENTSRAQDLLDAVRERVGLSSVTVTLDNIYNERMLELATEGHRWFDLVRTGEAASVLAFKGFVAGTHELLPIPLEELNNTLLVQNPGY